MPLGHPCLPGDFPGEPIAPAVLLSDLSCAEPCCTAHGPIRPDQTVHVSFYAGEAPTTLHFNCETRDGVATNGLLLFAGSP